MEFNQLFGHLGTPLQAAVLALQLLDPALTRIGRLAPGCLRLQTLQTMLGLLLAPSRKLGGIEAIAAQPGSLLAVRKGVGFGQKAQLLRRTEAAPCPLFQLRIGSNLGRGG